MASAGTWGILSSHPLPYFLFLSPLMRFVRRSVSVCVVTPYCARNPPPLPPYVDSPRVTGCVLPQLSCNDQTSTARYHDNDTQSLRLLLRLLVRSVHVPKPHHAQAQPVQADGWVSAACGRLSACRGALRYGMLTSPQLLGFGLQTLRLFLVERGQPAAELTKQSAGCSISVRSQHVLPVAAGDALAPAQLLPVFSRIGRFFYFIFIILAFY